MSWTKNLAEALGMNEADVASVYRLVMEAIRSTHHWFDGLEIQGLPESNGMDFEEAAMVITSYLLSGECTCYGRRAFANAIATEDRSEAEKLDFNGLRAQQRCLHEHSLAAWDSAVCSEEDFIAQAIKGSKPRHKGRSAGGTRRSSVPEFAPGGVAQGMYFDYLADHFNLRFGDCWAWTCLHQDAKGNPQSQVNFTRACSSCKAGFNPKLHKGKEVRALFYVRGAAGGSHDEARFLRCENTACGNVFEVNTIGPDLNDKGERGDSKKRKKQVRNPFWTDKGQNTCPLDGCKHCSTRSTLSIGLARFEGNKPVSFDKKVSHDTSATLLDFIGVEYDPTTQEARRVCDFLAKEIDATAADPSKATRLLILKRFYVQDQSVERIAEVLHLPVAEVKAIVDDLLVSEQRQLAVALLYFRDKSMQEIAKALHMTIKEVESIVEELRDHLENPD